MVAGFRQQAAALCLAFGAVLATTQAGQAQMFINEIFFNVGGGGDDLREEYIELRGLSGASLDNHYLLILENELPGADSTNRAGVVERIFDLNTRSMGANGFLTLRQKSSRYTVASGTTDLVNMGAGAGYGNGSTSSIGASSNGDNDLEGGGFTAMLIRNDSGAAPTLNLDLDTAIDNDNDPLTEKDGLDHPGMGQPGWTILDSIGIFAEPEETETGRLYGNVNYARWDQLIPNDFVPQIEPGTAFQKINFEIEYAGRWGNSTGNAVGDWHISNFTDNLGSGSLLGVSNPAGPDWRQSCVPGAGCHAANDFNPATPAPQPVGGMESNHAVPYGTKLANTLGAANFMFGDYNRDGVVDAADYTVWRDTMGATGTESNHPAADTNHDFLVNGLDYDIWMSNFGEPDGNGAGGGSMGVAGVPEPTTWMLLAIGVVLAGALPRRKA